MSFMTSGGIDRKQAAFYRWRGDEDPNRYVRAAFVMETAEDPELAAAGLASEQSSGTLELGAYGMDIDLDAVCAKVVSVETLGEAEVGGWPGFQLPTASYPMGQSGGSRVLRAAFKLAFPIANFRQDLTQLWNFVCGESFRMGYLRALRLVGLEFPEGWLREVRGPRFGVAGLRDRFALTGRPLLLRSTRPAVGLTTDQMEAIAERVLRGGFDAIKDDELTGDGTSATFEKRCRRMAALADRLSDETSERKSYLASVIARPDLALERAMQAAAMGADGLLVAPTIQGLEIAGCLADRSGLPVMAHNAGEDLWVRHPRFGIEPHVHILFQRLAGADMIFLPAGFGATDIAADVRACAHACLGPLGGCRPSLPVIAGGVHPEHLGRLAEAIGGVDFAVIVASSVDTYNEGPDRGARAFRDAWEELRDAFPPGA